MTGNNGLEILSYSTSPGTKWVENCCKPESGIPLWVMWAAAWLWAVKWLPSLSQAWVSRTENISVLPWQPQWFIPPVLQPCWGPHRLPRGYKLQQSLCYCLPLPLRSSELILCLVPTTLISVLCTEIAAMIPIWCHTKIKEIISC